MELLEVKGIKVSTIRSMMCKLLHQNRSILEKVLNSPFDGAGGHTELFCPFLNRVVNPTLIVVNDSLVLLRPVVNLLDE